MRRWVKGEAAVDSRLVVDVRDAALAHINAATLPAAANRRYIVSCEAREPARRIVDEMASRLGKEAADRRGIHADDAPGSGAIPIGAREVDAVAVARELGVCCRPTRETLADMAEALCAADAAL